MATSRGDWAVTDGTLEQLIAAQEKIMFLEMSVSQLNDALVAKEHALAAVEQRVAALESAIRTLAHKAQGKSAGDEVANAEEDPVPSSG